MPCPASEGTLLALPPPNGATGFAFGSGPIRVIIPQGGDLVHGSVDLAPSNVSGWFGIKTLWASRPSYTGWIVIRAEQLDGPGPIAALGEAAIGAVVIPPGPTANQAGGWREQPSGTYVKHPGCYGFQVDGSALSETIVIEAVA